MVTKCLQILLFMKNTFYIQLICIVYHNFMVQFPSSEILCRRWNLTMYFSLYAIWNKQDLKQPKRLKQCNVKKLRCITFFVK